VKPAQAPVRKPVPMKNQFPSVTDEPTPVWGQPWRKGKPSGSNNLSNQATKPVQVSPPLPPVFEKPPTPPPVATPAPEPAPIPAPTPPAQNKPKTAKQLRTEKSRKGKNKAAATVTVTREDTVEEQEEVPVLPPQQPQAPVPQKAGLDAAIDNMVNTGNFQSALEQINWAWR